MVINFYYIFKDFNFKIASKWAILVSPKMQISVHFCILYTVFLKNIIHVNVLETYDMHEEPRETAGVSLFFNI